MRHLERRRLSQSERVELCKRGYVVIRDVLSNSQCGLLAERLENLWRHEGALAGVENYFEPQSRRLANLANKDREFLLLAAHPLALSGCSSTISGPFRLSMLNARDVLPGSSRQAFHCDTERRAHARHGYSACTAIWMLDQFTEENGATRIIPGSHLTRSLPETTLEDCQARHSNEVCVAGGIGDLLIMNGHVWHAGGEHRVSSSPTRRRAILVHYLRADCMPDPEQHAQRLVAFSARELTSAERAITQPFRNNP